MSATRNKQQTNRIEFPKDLSLDSFLIWGGQTGHIGVIEPLVKNFKCLYNKGVANEAESKSGTHDRPAVLIKK